MLQVADTMVEEDRLFLVMLPLDRLWWFLYSSTLEVLA
jgi:hypothetical protein